jgi:hypothetical protein
MNKHRGSDFNDFLIEEGIMTPTPRTDAIAHRGLGSVAYIAEMTNLARQLERENQTFRAAQKACEDCDAPRVDRIAELERDLAELTEWREMIDREVGTLREELAAERALADRLAGTLANVQGDYATTGAITTQEVAESLTSWKEARNGTC